MVLVIGLMASVFLGVLKNMVSRWGRDVFVGSARLHLCNAVSSAVACILMSIGAFWGPQKWYLESSAFAMALLYAFFTAAAQICYIKAVDCGSLSVSSLFYSCGFIIPSL